MIDVIRALKESRVFRISPCEKDFENRLVEKAREYRNHLIDLLAELSLESDRKDLAGVVRFLDGFIETKELPYLLFALEICCECGIAVHSDLSELITQLWEKVKRELED